MVTTRLEILDIDVSFGQNIPVSIDYLASDINEPDKVKGSFSKTILLPESNEINKIFENIFEINISTSYFNKNKKTKVRYIVNEIENFRGYLQLLSININPDKSKTYELSILGAVTNLFQDIGEKLITGNQDTADDLDFSAYDHVYNRTTQKAKRSNAGTGLNCIYGHVENGNNGGIEDKFDVFDFIPMFHVYEYISKIISKTGRTFTSTILNSATFKKHVVYPNIDKLKVRDSVLANSKFYVGLNSDIVTNVSIPYLSGGVGQWFGGTSFPAIGVINFNNETSPFGDPGNMFFGGHGIINKEGNYVLVYKHNLRFTWSHTNGTVASLSAIHSVEIYIRTSPDGISWNLVKSVFQNFDIVSGIGGNFETDINVVTDSLFLTTGTYVEVRFHYLQFSGNFYTAGNVLVTTGTATLTHTLKSGATGTSFYNAIDSRAFQVGDTVYANDVLPVNIKQKDLFKWIIQAFKLLIDVDPNDDKNLIIETYDDYYNSTIENFENRTDTKKNEVISVNTFTYKSYVFRYSQDEDYYNKLYFEKHKEPYGTQELKTDNEFNNEQNVIELGFAATPLVANNRMGVAVPKIYKKENNVIQKITPKIRLLTCSGVKTSLGYYTYTEKGAADEITNQYLYVGHVDDPLNPTYDLCFGVPKTVYYNFLGSKFTTNNLYNKHHRNFILNITDKDSKIVKKYLWVNSLDIKNFSFRKRLFIDGAYYVVDRISNYTPLNEDSTLFEMYKLNNTAAFQGIATDYTDINYNIIDVSNLNNTALINNGTSNQVSGENSLVNGSYNYISELAVNSAVLGNDNNITDLSTNSIILGNSNSLSEINNNINIIGGSNNSITNLSNVTLINSNNIIPTEGNCTYINGAKIIELTGETHEFTSIILGFYVNPTSINKLYTKVIAVNIATNDFKEWEGAANVKCVTSSITYYGTSFLAGTATGAMTGTSVGVGSTGNYFYYNLTGLAGTTISWKIYVEIVSIWQI